MTQTDLVEYVKEENQPQDEDIKYEWNYVADKINPITGPNCNDEFYQVGPLLKTSWDQGCSYNNLLGDCSNSYCNKQLTGCVATAMSQIMKYKHKPNSYNWNNMPLTYGTIDTQNLMKDVGNAVGMNYGCGSSSANSTDIAPAFNNLGYNASYTSNYTHSRVLQQLDWGNPVILTGGRKKDNISWNMYTDGHAWVCDGYQYIDIKTIPCDGTSIGYVFLHMNWGWGGQYNTWFTAHNFNPGTHTYNYGNCIIDHITPY